MIRTPKKKIIRTNYYQNFSNTHVWCPEAMLDGLMAGTVWWSDLVGGPILTPHAEVDVYICVSKRFLHCSNTICVPVGDSASKVAAVVADATILVALGFVRGAWGDRGVGWLDGCMGNSLSQSLTIQPKVTLVLVVLRPYRRSSKYSHDMCRN